MTGLIFVSLLWAGPLTWDDDTAIFNNPYILSGDWLGLWRDPYFGLYVPVASQIWALIYKVGGGSAIAFRILNLSLHLANAALVFLLLKGLAKRWGLTGTAVFFGTAIFALHPLQVHAVAWLSGGRDLLAACFALASVAVYFRAEKVFRTDYALATALFLIGTLCKPSVAILPFIILGLDWIFRGKLPRSRVLLIVPWLIFAGAVVWLAKIAADRSTIGELHFGQRLVIALDTYSFYLQKFVAPLAISANYGRAPEAALADGAFSASVIMSVVVLIGFIVLSWRQDRRYLLALLWFVAMIPASGLIPFSHQEISTVSDHYNYLSMALLAAVTVFVLSRIEWSKLVSSSVLILLIAGFSFASWSRVQTWSTDEAFFTDMSKISPDSYPTALGMSIVMCEDVKNYEEGIKWTERALKARPLDILALANQAYCFLHARNYFRVIELEYYLGQLNIEEIEQNQPTAYASLLSSIGSAYIEQQEYEDGFQFLCEAVRVLPEDPSHGRNLEIAKGLLSKKGIEPTCEQVSPDDDQGLPLDPIQDIWPQLEEED